MPYEMEGFTLTREAESTPAALLRAAQQGAAADQVAWARCLMQGRGVKRDPAAAVEWLRKAAEQDCPEACFELARCAEGGRGLPQDSAEAASLYRQSAELGYPDAQYSYAMCLLGGIGCSYDPALAEEWLHRAAQQGHKQAQDWLATLSSAAGPAVEAAPTGVPDLQQLLPAPPQAEDADMAAEPAPAAEIEMQIPLPAPEDASNGPVPEEAAPVSTEAETPAPPAREPAEAETEETAEASALRVQQVAEFLKRSQPKPRPVPASKKKNDAFRLYMIIMGLAGGAAGFLLSRTYSLVQVVNRIGYGTGFTVYMIVTSACLGLLLAFAVRPFYRKANDTLPFYGLILLFPLLIYFISYPLLVVLSTVWSIVVVIVQIILAILIVIAALAIIGYFFG